MGLGVTAADPIVTNEPDWLLEGVVPRGVLTLMVAPPKVGKTRLAVGLVAALLGKKGSFIDRAVTPMTPPQVIIFGPDMPEAVWMTMLGKAGLCQRDHEGNERLQAGITLFHEGNCFPPHQNGIDAIRRMALAQPGSLMIVDTLHSFFCPLRIGESSVKVAEPLRALSKALLGTNTTGLLLHHVSYATGRSRGSSAIPAAASQIVTLSELGGSLIKLHTKGRHGPEQNMTIRLNDDGIFESGKRVEEEALVFKLETAEDELQPRERTALRALRRLSPSCPNGVTAAAVVAEIGQTGGPDECVGRRPLNRLVRHGLATSWKASNSRAMENRYQPVVIDGLFGELNSEDAATNAVVTVQPKAVEVTASTEPSQPSELATGEGDEPAPTEAPTVQSQHAEGQPRRKSKAAATPEQTGHAPAEVVGLGGANDNVGPAVTAAPVAQEV
ncbi:AAA family ATPase [Cyanobium sp. ATX 6F1]|uniref:AAA family ATPase n=1 Tax=Cyanobium sp. ATX 6F1 TaxID=2823702 RepID=UPI0020CF2C08|nr:AAA family ATPase [Cyanobium sp. ATX 6F1]